MSLYADLHLHTRFSDGTYAPEEVARQAAALGFSAIAVTDHDTVNGVAATEAACAAQGLSFLHGVEISAQFDRMEVHITGLGIRLDCPHLMECLGRLRRGRLERGRLIIERLKAEGVTLDVFSMDARMESEGALGRMHIARALAQQGYAKTVQQAFDKFLNPGRRAYVPKARMECVAAIEAIHAAGGLAFLAHPGIGTVYKSLARILRHSFDGIEAYHSKHSPGQTEEFLELARERNCLVAGGSDCHGHAKGVTPEMGKVHVPIVYIERIQEALAARGAGAVDNQERA